MFLTVTYSPEGRKKSENITKKRKTRNITKKKGSFETMRYLFVFNFCKINECDFSQKLYSNAFDKFNFATFY